VDRQAIHQRRLAAGGKDKKEKKTASADAAEPQIRPAGPPAGRAVSVRGWPWPAARPPRPASCLAQGLPEGRSLLFVFRLYRILRAGTHGWTAGGRATRLHRRRAHRRDEHVSCHILRHSLRCPVAAEPVTVLGDSIHAMSPGRRVRGPTRPPADAPLRLNPPMTGSPAYFAANSLHRRRICFQSRWPGRWPHRVGETTSPKLVRVEEGAHGPTPCFDPGGPSLDATPALPASGAPPPLNPTLPRGTAGVKLLIEAAGRRLARCRPKDMTICAVLRPQEFAELRRPRFHVSCLAPRSMAMTVCVSPRERRPSCAQVQRCARKGAESLAVLANGVCTGRGATETRT